MITDAAGETKILWTLGKPAGLQRMAIKVAGDTAESEATALARPGKPAKLAFVGPPETAKPGKPLPKPVVVQVTDAYGNPLGGQTVVFKPNTGTVTPGARAHGCRRARQGALDPRPEGEEAGARRERQRERCKQDAGAQRSAVMAPTRLFARVAAITLRPRRTAVR